MKKSKENVIKKDKDKRQRKQSEEEKETEEKAASNRIGRLCLMDVS